MKADMQQAELGIEARAPHKLSQSTLNIEEKTRSNLLPWRGQFSPQLVEALLKNYAHRGCVVLDPFVGSGTVLCESGRLGLEAVGAEINPAAVTLARTYSLINVPLSQRRGLVTRAAAHLRPLLDSASPLFAKRVHPLEDVRAELVAICAGLRHGPTKSLVEAAVALSDFYKGPVTPRAFLRTWTRIVDLIQGLPYSEGPIRAELADARRLPTASGSIDLVVTSPPYINVFNYHQQYRASMEALDWDLLAVASAEIGSNRKHRANRFLTVIQYCLDMTQVLIELRRVCKSGARLVLVLGRESQVRKTPFFNGDIVEALATRCAGMSLRIKQERVFTNKFGMRIYEDLLHMEPLRAPADDSDVVAREIAARALEDARRRAPKESLADLSAAIESVQRVQPSSFFDLESSRTTHRQQVALGATRRAHSNATSHSAGR